MTGHLLLAALAVYHLAGAPAKAPAPRMQATLEQDAGEKVAGAPLRVVFPIRNTGKAPLEITRITPECRCMVSQYDRRLAPGASGAINVTLNTSGRHGRIEKHLIVESNDPVEPAITLTLKVVLHQIVEVSPSERIRVPLRPGEPAQQELIVRSYEKTPLEVTRVACSSPSTQARLLPRDEFARRLPDDPSAFQIVQITVPAASTPARFDETVTIDTNSAARPRITVRLEGKPLKAFSVRPMRLDMGSLSPTAGQSIGRVIDVIRQWGGFKVLGASATDPRLQVSVEPDPEGAYFRIRVEYDGGWKPGTAAGEITIRTDDPQRPVIRVPYTAQVRGLMRS